MTVFKPGYTELFVNFREVLLFKFRDQAFLSANVYVENFNMNSMPTITYFSQTKYLALTTDIFASTSDYL